MADLPTGAAGEMYKDVKSLFGWIQGKYDYAKNLEQNYNSLHDNAGMLYERMNVVADEENRDRRMQLSGECEAWIRRVKRAKEEEQNLVTKYEKETRHKWKWLRPWSRSNLSKRMVEKSKELNRLREEGGIFPTRSLVERLPECVRLIPAAPKTEKKPSLHRFVEEIIHLVGDQKVRRVKLWGMVGTGKTTIMQNVNNNKTISEMFDIVIWVTVSRDQSIERLQGTITQRLKLKMDGDTNTGDTSWRISEELKDKKYLLLLDEVCSDIDLDALGVHENHACGKVVLATRVRDICCNMDAHEINVKRVSDSDAWKIFLEKVGDNIGRPGIIPTAQKVVNECAGLPLLIDRVARFFKTKDDIHIWRDGLNRLKRWPRFEIKGTEEVLKFLEFCYYEHLKGDDERACFLYIALYPEDCEIYIDYLVECWRAEGLIDDKNGFKDARDRGRGILCDLINASLLEKCEKIKNIRMNKVLREVALRILSQGKDSKFLVVAREGSQELPNEEEWKLADRISLMDNELCKLPETPCCNHLLTLLLQKNSKLTSIPNAFFESMQTLRVLDLHCTGITSLPTSLSNLIRLRALYLNSCKYLRELPPNVEALEDLEVLDIRGTGINYLPLQIRSLSKLKCLRISLSKLDAAQSSNMNINDKVISHLSLEELSIDVDPGNQWWDQVVEAITEEVATLTTLTSLSFCFPRVDSLNIFITRSRLWRENCFKFQFSVGYHDSTQCEILNYFDYQIYKCLKIANGEGVAPAISEVLAETDAFELIGHKGVSKLSDFGIESLNTVRGCLIERCNEMKTIINSNTIQAGVLECLEKMYIKNAPELESIWEGPVHSGSLALLTTLTLYECPKLMKIFSNGMIQQLYGLQHLRVEKCLEIEEIIMESENRSLDLGALPRLKTMELLHLPKLSSIWVNDSLKWQSLERMKIFMCNSLTRLPFKNNNALRMRSIEGQRAWWSALVWQEAAIEERFELIRVFI